METPHNGYKVSDEPGRFDLARAYQWISVESYWGAGIPRGTFEKAVAGSLTIGVYAADGQMAIMAFISDHPDLQGFRRMHLATRDAHGLYAQYGFGPLTGADRWMEIRKTYV